MTVEEQKYVEECRKKLGPEQVQVIQMAFKYGLGIKDVRRLAIPKLMIFSDDSKEIKRLIKKVRESGARIFINSLWPELCGGHDDDRAVELHQSDDSWGWIIDQGAKLIQTDRPALLLEYLEKKGLRD